MIDVDGSAIDVFPLPIEEAGAHLDCIAAKPTRSMALRRFMVRAATAAKAANGVAQAMLKTEDYAGGSNSQKFPAFSLASTGFDPEQGPARWRRESVKNDLTYQRFSQTPFA